MPAAVFGRRANPRSDYVLEAVQIAKASGLTVPIKMFWTRADDMRGGYYRPMYQHALKAGLDADGKLIAWRHRIVGQSLFTGTVIESDMVKDGIDSTSVDGAVNLPYRIPNLRVELHTVDPALPVLWWRSVGSSHNAFAVEVFLDQLADATGHDPLTLRRELLADSPRHLRVLELAAEKARWGQPLAAGRGRGIALHETFETVVAQVVEVTTGRRNRSALRVDRVVCAVDCGTAVNPDQIAAQMESGIGYGLAAALYGEIHLRDGRVRESNFHDYVPLRLREMPAVETYIVPSTAPPSGVGEAGLPPLAPALSGAIAAATGQRHRRLPLRPS